jgi:hypothetical protein
MAYPTIYDVTYSYTGFQQGQGGNAFPGTQIDADLAGLDASISNLLTFVKGVMRSDGALNNGVVTLDSLDVTVAAKLGDTTAVTTLLAASASAVAAATTANADVVSTHADVVSTHADVTTAGASATAAAGSATAAATSATNAAATLASAVVGPVASVDGEVMLFSGVTGKLARRATAITGILKTAAGVLAAAVAGTDYVAPGTATAFTAQQSSTLAVITDQATLAWAVGSAQKAKVTLGGNRTMGAVTGAIDGTTYFLWAIQDATGSRTITWTTTGAGSFDFGIDGPPTLTTTANKADLVCFEAVSIAGTLKLRHCGTKRGFA